MQSKIKSINIGRRAVLQAGLAGVAVMAVPRLALSQTAPYRVGLMLPASGTFAVVGDAIANGFKLALAEYGNKFGGRPVEIFSVDDASDPSKAVDNASRLIKQDKVNVLIGTVHSGVAMAMAKVARDTKTLLIVPNAGANDLTGAFCAPNIFRTSFSNWQPGYAAGKLVADRKHQRVVTLAWKYTTGEELVRSFKEGFLPSGGSILKELYLPFPNVEFQSLLTEISGLRPDAVYAFIAGSGAVKLVKDYVSVGLKQTVPLYGPGFITDGLLGAMGGAAEGVVTTLHYADGLDTPKDNAFRTAYKSAYKNLPPDVFAVQGYDAAQLLQVGLTAVRGDVGDQAALITAMGAATIDSPRGKFTMSKSHNPIQDIYVREVRNGENRYVGIAAKALEDPGSGCRRV